MKKDSRILVTGGSGLLGRALTEVLARAGHTSVVSLSSRDLDLKSLPDTAQAFTERYKPEFVFHLAGTVFGIGGNLKDPGKIFLGNTLINTHVVESSRSAGVKKIVAMGSICAYPSPPRSDGALQEKDLFFGEPHPGERAYGHSKRGLLAQLEAYQAAYGLDYAFAISTNLYGPFDRFNLENGHVIPSLVKKFFEASQSGGKVEVWGDGSSRRDFMHSHDAAAALLAMMNGLSGRVNLATGKMTSIREVIDILGKVSGIADRVSFDASKPKGHEFVGIDVARLRSAGFAPAKTLEQGLSETYAWYAANAASART